MKNYIYCLLGLLAIFSLTSVAMNVITSTDSLVPVTNACALANNDTLVIFDIDDVLLTMIDNAFQTNEGYQFVLNILNKHKRKDWIYHIWEHCSLSLVDHSMLDVLNLLRNNAIPTLALTFGHAGPRACFEAYERIRYQRLQQLGIEFNWSFEDRLIVFSSIAIEQKNPPLFYKGIVSTCGIAKSKVLEEFLKHVNYMPKKIIFVDDMMFNINDLSQWCALHAIEYQAFHYTGLDRLITVFNEPRARYQGDYLIKHGIWLSDQEADRLRAQQL